MRKPPSDSIPKTNMIPKTCDVVVIGGGPTGSTAANKLASNGYHVVLLEKAHHPRNTVGESLIPHFWRYADAIGASKAIEDEGFIKKSGGLALWGNELRRLRFRDFGYDRPGLHIERDVFDNILLGIARQAGAQVYEGVQVTSLNGLEDPLTTVNYKNADAQEGSLQARYVIDASGQTAVVARQLKARIFDEALRFSAFWGYYRKSRYITYEGEIHEDADKYTAPPATLVSTIGDWGWAWHIVMRKTVSVGVIIPKTRLAQMRGKTLEEREQRFQKLITDVPLMGRLLDQGDYIQGSLLSMRDYAYKPASMTAGNTYLAGDAAAFVDPINSLGVVFAMFTGTFAAHAISRSLKNPGEAQLNRDLYSSQLGERLALFRLLALPDDAAHLSQQERDQAKKAIAASSASELQLMALQASVNARDGVLHSVFDELAISKRPKIESIDWQALTI